MDMQSALNRVVLQEIAKSAAFRRSVCLKVELNSGGGGSGSGGSGGGGGGGGVGSYFWLFCTSRILLSPLSRCGQ